VRWRARAATIVATRHNFTSTLPELSRHSTLLYEMSYPEGHRRVNARASMTNTTAATVGSAGSFRNPGRLRELVFEGRIPFQLSDPERQVFTLPSADRQGKRTCRTALETMKIRTLFARGSAGVTKNPAPPARYPCVVPIIISPSLKVRCTRRPRV
jgi:hypothetical protein